MWKGWLKQWRLSGSDVRDIRAKCRGRVLKCHCQKLRLKLGNSSSLEVRRDMCTILRFHIHVRASNMAATSIQQVLNSFTASTASAVGGLPESASLHPPDNGITLLDVKNELFLSYLQALALRNLSVLRGIKEGGNAEDAQKLSDKLTRKLVEHRVYLERGVRPLEQRIKYQVDKVVKAADDEERSAKQQAKPAAATSGLSKANDSSSDEEDDKDDDEDAATGAAQIDELSYRPNPAAFAAPQAEAERAERRSKSSADGVYRPPRISATAMPEIDQKQKRDRGPGRSATVDEYISNELSTAPQAQPSIGSNVTAGGRSTKNAKDIAREQERRNYEETNLVRLPKESKKELAKRRDRYQGQYGGEEWKGLGQSLDRIGDLTKRKGGSSSALEKSRKRQATEDGPRGDGIGASFDVKKRRMDKKTRR